MNEMCCAHISLEMGRPRMCNFEFLSLSRNECVNNCDITENIIHTVYFVPTDKTYVEFRISETI